MTGRSSFFGRSSLSRLGQTGQLFLFGNKTLTSIRLGHYILTKTQTEHSQLAIDLFEALFLLCRQVGSVIDKRLIGLGQQTHLLWCESQIVAFIVYSLNAGKKGFVHHYSVVQLTQTRSDNIGYRIHLGVTIGFQYIEECAAHLLQEHTGAVQSFYRIGKCRCIEVIDDSLYLGLLTSDTFLKGRHIVFQLYLVESRYSIWSLHIGQERILTSTGKSHKCDTKDECRTNQSVHNYCILTLRFKLELIIRRSSALWVSASLWKSGRKSLA